MVDDASKFTEAIYQTPSAHDECMRIKYLVIMTLTSLEYADTLQDIIVSGVCKNVGNIRVHCMGYDYVRQCYININTLQ